MRKQTSQPTAILIIDDDESIRGIIADILELEKIPTFQAGNGREGLALYQKHQDQIGLILLDLQLPDTFGTDVLKQLQQLNPQVEVLIVTGIYNPRQHLGTDLELLHKPFSIASLLTIVKKRLSKIMLI